MRKLATICQIGNLTPIKNADFIEVAKLKDRAWQCVVKKGSFDVGDIGVYFEIDSFLPYVEPFMFLKGRCDKKMRNVQGFRLKTIRLRGTLSQGLVLPLSDFPNLDINKLTLGDDVTEILGVVLYEAPIPASLNGQVKGNFPSFISKTDEERLQNLLYYFDDKKDDLWEVTVKLDGTSGTFYHRDDNFGVCSRNLELKKTDGNTYWEMEKKYNLAERLANACKTFELNVALQGEIIGDGIQKNRCGMVGHHFYLFNIFNIDHYRYLDPSSRQAFLKYLNSLDGETINHVPVVSKSMKVFSKFTDFDSLHDWVSSHKSLNNTTVEGLVFKNLDKDISFKVINNKYLLKHNE